jgi:hypothetical protein
MTNDPGQRMSSFARRVTLVPVLSVFAFAAALALVPGSASARDEQAFLDRFSGSWQGSATLMKNSVPWQLSCRVVGDPTPDHVIIEGSCNLAIISVRIAADITYDPKSGRYSGTYIGADVGPARVTGTRKGDAVNLTITWPKPVNGDTKGRMIIQNSGGGNLKITTFDNLVVSGPQVLTTRADLRIAGGPFVARQ